jgi:hypothetical protein
MAISVRPVHPRPVDVIDPAETPVGDSGEQLLCAMPDRRQAQQARLSGSEVLSASRMSAPRRVVDALQRGELAPSIVRNAQHSCSIVTEVL